MDVKLPNGQVIKGVPEGTPKEEIMRKAIRAGIATEADFAPAQTSPEERQRLRPEESGDIGGFQLPNEQDDEGTYNRRFKVAAGLMSTSDPQRQMRIIAENFPGVVFDKDQEGNFIVDARPIGGSRGYLNEPGLDQRDAIKFAGTVMQFLPAGRWAAGANTLGGQVARAAAGEGVVQAAVDVGNQALGGTETVAPENIDKSDVATSAALGAGGALVLGGVVAPALKRFAEKSAFKKELAKKLEQGSTDTATAKYMLNGSGKVATDPTAKEAIKQGFDEATVAIIKGANPLDRQKMQRMLGILEQGQKNQRFSVIHRASDVVGDSLLERFKAVKAINKRAGNQLDFEAKKLIGQPVDVDGVMDGFVRSLQDDLGVTILNGKPNFSGSAIEGLDGPQKFLMRLVGRLRNTRAPDAYDVHRMKKFIDEQVSFGKTAEGLGGKTELVAKKLRRQFDELLDSNFPSYDKVNTQYADTIGALDAFQKAAGSTIDLASDNAEKAIGTLSRRLMSNAQSRVRLLDAVEGLQTTAGKYGKAFDDDVVTQALFVDELERIFGPAARTSLQGETEKAFRQGVNAVQGGTGNILLEATGKALEHARGITPENAIRSLKQLLKNAG